MAFPRPKKPHQPPPWRGQPSPGASRTEQADEREALTSLAEQQLAPSGAGTTLALIGLAFTGAFLSGKAPFDVAQFAAYGAGISILLSVLWDMRRGLHNLMRADVLAIVGLYFLTLFEFLVPQPEFNSLTTVESTSQAITACLLGLAGLYIGRHIILPSSRSLTELLQRPLPTRWLIITLIACLVLGHLQMMIAVDFDLVKMVDAMTGPRFSQPWGRGRLGDWKALLYELSMLLFLIPPIAGVAFARRHLFSKGQLIIAALGLGFELFYGFSSGTRNLFISFLVAFLISYAFALPRGRRSELLAVTGIVAGLTLLATVLMLSFRQIGLKAWVQGYRVESPIEEKLVHVDMNLFVIAQLTEVFPKQQEYLGLQVPYLAIIRPIPRAIWPGKPKGMSVSLESASGADEEGWTVAASFVGEAYVAGGMVAVLIFGAFFGLASTWWSRLATPKNSEVGVLIYASGFVAVAISMRSLFVFTTALLPTLAVIIGGRFLMNYLKSKDARVVSRQRMAMQRRNPVRPVKPNLPPGSGAA